MRKVTIFQSLYAEKVLMGAMLAGMDRAMTTNPEGVMYDRSYICHVEGVPLAYVNRHIEETEEEGGA